MVSSSKPPQPGPRRPDSVALIPKTGDFSTQSLGPYYPPESYEVFLGRKDALKNGPRVQIDEERDGKTFACRPAVAGQTNNGPSFNLNYTIQTTHHSGHFTSGGIVMSSLGDKLTLESLSFSATSGPWGWHANLVPNPVQATGNLDQDTSFTASIPAGATFSWGDSSGDVYNLTGSLSVSYTGSVVTVQINASGSIASHNLHQFGEAGGMSITGSATFNASKGLQNCGIGVGLSLHEQLDLQNPDNDKLRLYYGVNTQDFGHALPFNYNFVESDSKDNTGTCPPLPPRSGTKELSYSDEFWGRYADGTYTATASFEAYPQEEARTRIRIFHPLELELFPSELHTSPNNPDNLPYDHVEFAVSGPLCPDWRLRIPVKTASGDCIWEEHGSGFKEGINWDLTCNGQKVLPGLYHAELAMPYSYSPIKRPIKILGCVSGPQPSQEPTYDPSGFPIPPAYTPPPCEEEKKCENTKNLFPSLLLQCINEAQNLVAPIVDPAPMNQDLGDWQKLMKKLKDRQGKIAAEQQKTNPNQNKINNWQTEANTTVDQLDVLTPRIQNRVNQMDTARPALRNELNTVSEQPNFSKDSYPDQQVNVLPQTMKEYKEILASLSNQFDLRVLSKNSYDLLTAASILANEQELYGHLVRDILSEKIPLTPEETEDNSDDDVLENLNTPRKIVRWLNKRLGTQMNKLRERQQSSEQHINQLLQGLNLIASDYTQDYHQQLEQQLLNKIDAAQAILNNVESGLLAEEQSFTIQANNNQAQKRENLQKDINKVQETLRQITSGIKNGMGHLVEEAQSRLPKQLTQLQNKALAYGGDALAQVQQFYRDMDQTMGWLPQWQVSLEIRKQVLQCTGAQDPLAFLYFSDLTAVKPRTPTPNHPPQDLKIFDSTLDVSGLIPGVVYNYVVTENNRFIVSKRGDRNAGAKHSQLTGGAPARAGGELVFMPGNIQINNETGRYRRQDSHAIDRVSSYLGHSGNSIQKVNGPF